MQFPNIHTAVTIILHWTKEGKTVKEINIGGLHASVDCECNGTAVFIEGHRNSDPGCSSHLWGLEFTGLRVAGAFKYGVYGTNNSIWVDSDGVYVSDPTGQTGLTEKWSWTNDMKINGIIDGCETGVYLDHCNHAYISTSIQPRPAYDTTTGEATLPYALNGIFLNNCVNANLIGSRVWDWTKKNTLVDESIENQHIRLDGDCYGLILDDFNYYEMDDYDIRDLIYTDTPENFDTMSILQEPVSKFFRIDTDKTKVSLFADRMIDTTEGNKGEIITNPGTTVSGMIDCKNASNISIDGLIPHLPWILIILPLFVKNILYMIKKNWNLP